MSVKIQSPRLNLDCADRQLIFCLNFQTFFGVSTNYLVLGIHPEDMGGSLNEKIDEAITQIDSTIEKLLIKREELLKMKSELE